MFTLIRKEIKDILKTKAAVIYFLLLFLIIAYSFFSAVDLYSKASVSAVSNPLYAAGFEPVFGVFVPTFGGLFMVFSLIAPFLFVRLIGKEKEDNTIPLLLQFPFSIKEIFLYKSVAGFFVVVISILIVCPVFVIWYFLGGFIPIMETVLLIFGYLLYGFLVLSVSVFASVIFNESSNASVFALWIIISSWFVDFGKDMNIIPFAGVISKFSLTATLKVFENGILSVFSVLYLLLLSVLFLILGYIYFNLNIVNKLKYVIVSILLFVLSVVFAYQFQVQYDLTMSKKHSFSYEKTNFLKKIGKLKIKVYMEPTDSRYKDYENDFLKKLKLVKRNVVITFAKGDELKENYGLFKYFLNGKEETTYSNSEEEIFMILQKLTGTTLKKAKDNHRFKGYPLVVEKGWSKYLFFVYLILFPLLLLVFLNLDKIFYKENCL